FPFRLLRRSDNITLAPITTPGSGGRWTMAARKRTPNEPPQKPPETPRRDRGACAVVGIGASAGGLEALQQFFRAMPADGGLACVITPPPDPARESPFAPVLARYTAMSVKEVVQGERVAPNRVYVIPPGKYLVLQKGGMT